MYHQVHCKRMHAFITGRARVSVHRRFAVHVQYSVSAPISNRHHALHVLTIISHHQDSQDYHQTLFPYSRNLLSAQIAYHQRTIGDWSGRTTAELSRKYIARSADGLIAEVPRSSLSAMTTCSLANIGLGVQLAISDMCVDYKAPFTLAMRVQVPSEEDCGGSRI